MKKENGMAGSLAPDVPVVEVRVSVLEAARLEARMLRARFDKLSPLERMAAAEEIAAVERLVRAVEGL
ncbi:hypothetical protein [Burkholderia savannae]|uniref:hypothetical protein n=1 Tax=Burkholderia savannae TaxID=1637837 RepID=UPI0012F52209|nr:hypothetical protein [Burkholderia savannae]